MNENNKGNSENTNNPNSSSRNNKRYKYRNRGKKLADPISENSQDSTHEFSNNEKINTKKNSTNTQPLEGENVEKPSEKEKKRNRNLPSKLTGNEDWQIALAECIEANRISHENRSHPLKYDNSSKYKIHITPLGGLREIGGNISVFEANKDAIIVDTGMSFSDGTMYGVDIIIPDFDYVRKIKDKIRGIVITHAHEDHIGTVSHFFKEFQLPIYATPLALGMILNKSEEHGLRAERKWFRPVEKRRVCEVGEFDIEWIHIMHSITDTSALVIKTKAGTIIHTGDFRINRTPIDSYPTDLGRLAHYGEEGVLCLLSDSTNSYKKGYTKSESSVGPTLDQISARTKDRVIMSTFSPNIHRVYQAITYGLKYGRKVCVIGRSMERNLYTTMELGYIKLDRKIFIDADEASKYKNNEVFIVTIGSQGETMSALYRMATDKHKFIKIKPTDQVIISVKTISGNEASISAAPDYLLKAGVKVAYQEFSETHVSGHASIEE